MKAPAVAAAVALALLFAVVVSPLALAEQQKQAVSVSHSGDDTVGGELAFAVREALRRSEGYRLGTDKDALFTIHLVTLDPEVQPAGRGNWTTAAVVYTMANLLPLQKNNPQTWYRIFLTASIVTAGKLSVDDSAMSIVASLDRAVERYKSEAAGK